MTDTVFDSATGPASASAEVPVNPAVLDDVRAKLRRRGLDDDPQVVLLGLDGNGCVSVGRFDTSRGTVADTYSDVTLSLGALDHAIADHLTRIGRVESPTSPDWQNELFELIARGRERLQDSDGTFLMGRQHIRLFRMARRDVEEAGGALTARSEELACAAVAGAQAHAVVVADGLGVWPGLRDGIARAVTVPIIDAVPGPLAAAVSARPISPPPESLTPTTAGDGPEVTGGGDVPPDPADDTDPRDSGHPADTRPPGTHPADTHPADTHPADTIDSTDLTEPEAVDDNRDEVQLDEDAAVAAENSDEPVAGRAEPAPEPGCPDPEPEVEVIAEAVTEAATESDVDTMPDPVADEVTAPPIPEAPEAADIAPDAPTGGFSIPVDPPAGNPGRSGDFPVIGVEQTSPEQLSQPVSPAPATAFGALTASAAADTLFTAPQAPGVGALPSREATAFQQPTPVHAPVAFHPVEHAMPRNGIGHPGVGPAPIGPQPDISPAPEQYSLVNQVPPAPARRRGKVPVRRVLTGLALLCALAIVGVAVALAAGGNGSSQAPVATPTTPTTTAPTSQEYADPAIFAEARQPAQRYTSPPPPVATNEPAPSPRPRSRAPRPQRGVTIPNPIPGLPPIVLP